MAAPLYSDDHRVRKAFILKQGNEGVSVAEIRRKTGVSPATCFNWKKKL